MKANYTGYKRFSKAFSKLALEAINLMPAKEKKQLAKVLRNELFGLKGPRRLSKKLTRSNEIFSRVFYGFAEIPLSYECLLDAEIFIRQYPNYQTFKKRTITRTRYLRYHIEKYLENIYILKETLEVYINTIRKYFRADKTITNKINALKTVVLKPLQGIVNTRGFHVHQRRYNDEDIERLTNLEIFCEGEEPIGLLTPYAKEVVYPGVRNRWLKTVKENNKIIKELLDIYFDALYDLIFSSNGNIKIK